MTTHELARELLTHPDVPIHVEGWTSSNIKVVQPEWAKPWAGDEQPFPDARILVNADHHGA